MKTSSQSYLVGGLEHEFYDFPETVGNVIIPTDFHSIIFQRGRAQPPTRLSFPEVVVSLGILVSLLNPSKTSAGLWNFAAGLPAADLRLPLARRC